jgi:hypothetical protein
VRPDSPEGAGSLKTRWDQAVWEGRLADSETDRVAVQREARNIHGPGVPGGSRDAPLRPLVPDQPGEGVHQPAKIRVR